MPQDLAAGLLRDLEAPIPRRWVAIAIVSPVEDDPATPTPGS
jgi:hypothetical protein